MLILIILLVSGAIGASIASGLNRSAIAWFFICFLFPLIGHVVLMMFGNQAAETDRLVEAIRTTTGAASGATGTTDQGFDRTKWQALVEFDPELRQAAETIRVLGPQFEDKLAKSFLTLNDKSYLPAIVSKIQQEAATGPVIILITQPHTSPAIMG